MKCIKVISAIKIFLEFEVRINISSVQGRSRPACVDFLCAKRLHVVQVYVSRDLSCKKWKAGERGKERRALVPK